MFVTRSAAVLARTSHAFALAVLFTTAAAAGDAEATYSPPLARVRIDRDREVHTPSLVYALDRNAGTAISTELTFYGAQYIGQKEWAGGWGVQLQAGIGALDARVGFGADLSRGLDGNGFLTGGQLRGYRMLWASSPDDGSRGHALTAFINLRALYYSASGLQLDRATAERRDGRFHADSLKLAGGIGAMGEIAVIDWVSICPYAWISPGILSKREYRPSDGPPVLEKDWFSLRHPLQLGVDVWVYPFGSTSEQHISLSALGSLVDTEDKGDRELTFVLGYSF